MIGVSVEPCAGCKCAFGVALTLAFGVKEEVEVVDFAGSVAEARAVFVEECSGDDYLVKEVPLAFVGECADAAVEDFPPGIVELVRSDVFLVALRAEAYGT